MTDPRKGAKSHEAQIEDQCFKAAADGRDRDLLQSHGQGTASEISPRRQTQSDHPDIGSSEVLRHVEAEVLMSRVDQ